MMITEEVAELRYSLSPSLNEQSALDTAKHQLQHRGVMPKSLIEEATFEKPSLYYIPFLWLTGTTTALEEQVIEHPDMAPRIDTRVTIGDHEVFELAVKLKDWGLESINVATLLGKPHAPLPAPFDGAALREEGFVLVPQRTFRERPDLVAERRRLLFVPIWKVAYTIRGQRYETHIDGIDGELLSARGPEDERVRVPIALAAIFLPCLVMGKVFSLLLSAGSAGAGFAALLHPSVLVGLVVAALVGLSLFLSVLAFSWSLLRYEAEHFYRSGRVWSEQLGHPGQTLLDKLASRVAEMISGFVTFDKET